MCMESRPLIRMTQAATVRAMPSRNPRYSMLPNTQSPAGHAYQHKHGVQIPARVASAAALCESISDLPMVVQVPVLGLPPALAGIHCPPPESSPVNTTSQMHSPITTHHSLSLNAYQKPQLNTTPSPHQPLIQLIPSHHIPSHHSSHCKLITPH